MNTSRIVRTLLALSVGACGPAGDGANDLGADVGNLDAAPEAGATLTARDIQGDYEVYGANGTATITVTAEGDLVQLYGYTYLYSTNTDDLENTPNLPLQPNAYGDGVDVVHDGDGCTWTFSWYTLNPRELSLDFDGPGCNESAWAGTFKRTR